MIYARCMVLYALLIACVSGCRSVADSKPDPRSVIIVGAGLAGLASAVELKERGYHVVILEAKDRPGGRIHTIRKPFQEGQYAEAGATFVCENHSRTMRWIQKYGLSLSELSSNGPSLYYIKGQKYSVNGLEPVDWSHHIALKEDERTLSPANLLLKYAGEALHEIGDPLQPHWPPEKLMQFDGMTFAEFLRERGASEAAIGIIRLGYLDLWGNGIDAVSALLILRDLYFDITRCSKTYLIVGGSSRLPEAFAQRLKENILYESVVESIERDSQCVRVLYRDKSGKTQTMTASQMIITAPFSVLRRVRFSPPLPFEKQNAIDELPYTSVTRAFIQAKSRAWEKEGLIEMGQADTPMLNWIRNVTINQPGTMGIIETYLSGYQARKYDSLSEEVQKKRLVDVMKNIVPQISEEVITVSSYSWDKDPWQLGGYAWFRPGQMFSLMPMIARPEGRLHFAGDHTSGMIGWIEGAFHSAERSVQEIIDQTSSRDCCISP